jgi:hypothetical protein
MKKLVFLLFFVLFSHSFHAAPGDTTWITAFDKRKLTYPGAYDTSVVFPANLQCNKVILYLNIGRYACPGNPQYCGSWDYTFDMILKPTGNDTVQIGKYITPYASNWSVATGKHEYILDVTDYAKLMNGTNGLQLIYDGYSYGFTATLKFAFIEGTPYLPVQDIKRIYKRNYYYFGNTPGQIENQLTNNAVTTGSNISRAIVKNFISGHGSDNSTNCLEFCPMTYSLLIDNAYNTSQYVWRDNCGLNQVYPQTGTWVYDRANWCPGDVSYPYIHNVSSVITSNATHSVNIDMPNYANPIGQACYCLETQLITYGAPAFSNDVGVEWIYNPSQDDDAVRDNPTCSQPRILIKNYGSNNLTSAIITYSINNVAAQSYTWTGSLAFLDTVSVLVPGPSTIFPMPNTTNNDFVVNVTTNGDQNIHNNKMYSKFTVATQFNITKLVVHLITNASPNESSWYLYNESNSLVASRTVAVNNTVYLDSVNVSDGCYKFVMDDAGCDGLSWWANSAAGNGSVRFKDGTSGNVIEYFPGDFGCQFISYFTVNSSTTGLRKNSIPESVDVFPNPFADYFTVQFALGNRKNASLRLLSTEGKLLKQENFSKVMDEAVKVDTKDLVPGIYMAELTVDGVKSIKKVVKQ